MSHVDGSIDIRFTGSQTALAKLEQFMGEELASFRSFRDCAVSYDPVKHSLDLDLNVQYEDIFSFLGFVVSRVPEVGFSGEVDLNYVDCGERDYAIYKRKPGGVFQAGVNRTSWGSGELTLELKYAPEEEERVAEWLKTLPFSLKDIDYYENDPDDGYRKKDYWICGKDGQKVFLHAFLPEEKELRALEESLKALAAQVPSLEGSTAYYNEDILIVVDLHPGQEARVFTVPIETIPTGREDEFEDEFGDEFDE